MKGKVRCIQCDHIGKSKRGSGTSKFVFEVWIWAIGLNRGRLGTRGKSDASLKMLVASFITISTLVLPDRLVRSLRRQGGPQEMVASAAVPIFTLTEKHPLLECCPPCAVYCSANQGDSREQVPGSADFMPPVRTTVNKQTWKEMLGFYSTFGFLPCPKEESVLPEVGPPVAISSPQGRGHGKPQAWLPCFE